MAELGHVVFYVRRLDPAVTFYTQIVGLGLVGRIFGGRAAMLTSGRTHHELLLIEVGDAPGSPAGRRIGLYHVGWKIGDHLDDLRQVRDRLVSAGITIDGMSDHTVSQSLYLRDPDGNEVELYVDDPAVDWHQQQDWMEAPVKPLRL
jgi:catechol 2,3-dioxygenase